MDKDFLIYKLEKKIKKQGRTINILAAFVVMTVLIQLYNMIF